MYTYLLIRLDTHTCICIHMIDIHGAIPHKFASCISTYNKKKTADSTHSDFEYVQIVSTLSEAPWGRAGWPAGSATRVQSLQRWCASLLFLEVGFGAHRETRQHRNVRIWPAKAREAPGGLWNPESVGELLECTDTASRHHQRKRSRIRPEAAAATDRYFRKHE